MDLKTWAKAKSLNDTKPEKAKAPDVSKAKALVAEGDSLYAKKQYKSSVAKYFAAKEEYEKAGDSKSASAMFAKGKSIMNDPGIKWPNG